jgi:outer membrane protein assembly factor BamB
MVLQDTVQPLFESYTDGRLYVLSRDGLVQALDPKTGKCMTMY